MKVKELIAKLIELPQDIDIVIEGIDGQHYQIDPDVFIMESYEDITDRVVIFTDELFEG